MIERERERGTGEKEEEKSPVTVLGGRMRFAEGEQWEGKEDSALDGPYRLDKGLSSSPRRLAHEAAEYNGSFLSFFFLMKPQ